METIFVRRRYFDPFSPELRMISRFAGCKWQQTGTHCGHLNSSASSFAEQWKDSKERWEGKQVNPSGEEREWQCGRSAASENLMHWLLWEEEASLPKSRCPNMIVKATPIGPQTASTAAQPVRHLGELPKFLEALLQKLPFSLVDVWTQAWGGSELPHRAANLPFFFFFLRQS